MTLSNIYLFVLLINNIYKNKKEYNNALDKYKEFP